MKNSVASFFFLAVLLSATAVSQTREQGAKKSRERPSSLKICQGVPVPDGYVIVGYVTLSACPHGAYLLKKQEVSNAVVSQAAAPQTTSSRPRRVAGVPSLAATTPNSIPLNTTPPAVPEPSVEEVSAGDVVRIDTTLVTVPVSVLDRQGRFIPGLKREDFHLFEDGVEQAIAYFEPTEKPFTVALLLDTSSSTRFHLWEIKEAAIAFAKQLRPQDRVLVVTFSDEVLLLTEATNDQDVISTVIQVNANTGASTRLYDAVNLVVNERLNRIQGRKAIVLFTDGVDTSSYMSTYQSTLREAEELDALVYPIQYDTTDYMRAMGGGGSVTVTTSSSNWPFPGSSTSRVINNVPSNGAPLPGTTKADYERADQYLQRLADSTGGRLYRANDSTQLAQAFASIAEELRRQYSIGYYPQTGAIQADERRLIKVSVQRPNVAVRARNSYMRRTSASTTPQ
jgi:Ca-activated chloride channel homolog